MKTSYKDPRYSSSGTKQAISTFVYVTTTPLRVGAKILSAAGKVARILGPAMPWGEGNDKYKTKYYEAEEE